MAADTKQQNGLSETVAGEQGSAESRVVSELRERVAKVEAELAILRADLAPGVVAMRGINNELEEMRTRLRESELVVAAAKLRTLNEELAHEGIGRLRHSLRTLRDAGVIDDRGNLVRKGLPQEMRAAPDAV